MESLERDKNGGERQKSICSCQKKQWQLAIFRQCIKKRNKKKTYKQIQKWRQKKWHLTTLKYLMSAAYSGFCYSI